MAFHCTASCAGQHVCYCKNGDKLASASCDIVSGPMTGNDVTVELRAQLAVEKSRLLITTQEFSYD